LKLKLKKSKNRVANKELSKRKMLGSKLTS